VRWKFINEKRWRSVVGFEKRQGMLADPEIPIRVADPRDVEISLKPELQVQIAPLTQLIENDAIVDSLDPHVAPVTIVE
jgi:hypothetical protein